MKHSLIWRTCFGGNIVLRDRDLMKTLVLGSGGIKRGAFINYYEAIPGSVKAFVALKLGRFYSASRSGVTMLLFII